MAGGRPKVVTHVQAPPTRVACALARELALVQAFELILPEFLTYPLAELRERDHPVFTPLTAAGFMALGGLKAACPEVGVSAIGRCLGLEPTTCAGTLAVWEQRDWFRAGAAAVAEALGRPAS